MADVSPMPGGLLPKIQWLLNGAWWIPLLLAGDAVRTHDLEWALAFFVMFVACLVGLWVLDKPGRRQMAWMFIVGGAICLGVGIWMLATPEPAPNSSATQPALPQPAPNGGATHERANTGATPAPSTAPALPAARKLTNSEVERKQTFVNEGLDILVKILGPLADEAHRLGDLQRNVLDGSDKGVGQLDELKQTSAAFLQGKAKLQAFCDQTGAEYPDITTAIGPRDLPEVWNSIDAYREVLEPLVTASNREHPFKIVEYSGAKRAALEATLQNFRKWKESAVKKLIEIRDTTARHESP